MAGYQLGHWEAGRENPHSATPASKRASTGTARRRIGPATHALTRPPSTAATAGQARVEHVIASARPSRRAEREPDGYEQGDEGPKLKESRGDCRARGDGDEASDECPSNARFARGVSA